MHGIVHKTLKEYVVERTDEETWTTILEHADVESRLYLPVSTYDDGEIDAIFEALSSMAVQTRPQIERDFGRTLAPEFLVTFNAHVRDEWDLFATLERLESIRDDVDAATKGTLPTVTGVRESSDRVRVTYRTHREPVYCGVAHGLLEGLVTEFETTATVTKRACTRDGAEACVFLVERR